MPGFRGRRKAPDTRGAGHADRPRDGLEPRSQPLATRLELDRMREEDLPRVLEIERACFSDPWSRAAFLYEIVENGFAENYVLRAAEPPGRVEGYACVWFVEEEVQINNIAVAPETRRLGLGRRLMAEALEEGRRRDCKSASLQVRPGNEAALALYRSLGFVPVGRRRRYYSDTGEDAIVMFRPL